MLFLRESERSVQIIACCQSTFSFLPVELGCKYAVLRFSTVVFHTFLFNFDFVQKDMGKTQLGPLRM